MMAGVQPGGGTDTASAVALATESTQARTLATALLGGSAAYAFGNFLTKGLNFLLLPVYTRCLSPAEYGIIALAEIVGLVVSLLGGFGLASAISRLHYQHSGGERTRYVATALRLAAITMLSTLVLVFAVAPLVLKQWQSAAQVPFWPYIALAIGTAATTQAVQYRLLLYQLEVRPGLYNLLSISFFGLTTALTLFLVVVPRLGVVGVLGGKFVAGVLGAVVSVVLLQPWLAGKWSSSAARETLVLGFPLLFHEFMAAGLIAADRLILARYRGVNEVGLYSLAYGIGMALYLVNTSILQAWGPMFYDHASRDDDSRSVLGRIGSAVALAIIGVATLAVFLLPPAIRLFMDARYAAAARVVPWILGGYLLHGFFGLTLMGAMQAKRSQLILAASVSAFALNICLNFALAPRWGMYGAAWATLVSYGVEALVMFECSRRVFELPWQKNRIGFGILLFAAALALTQAHIPAWQSAIAAVAVVASLAWIAGRPAVRAARTILRSSVSLTSPSP